MISRAQCRAARALLDWTQDDLAQKARVSVTALRNFERGATIPVTNNLLALQDALEGAGIEFQNDDAPGVRLHARTRSNRKLGTPGAEGRASSGRKTSTLESGQEAFA